MWIDAYDESVKLRLYHHSDGARIAYWELGSGPALVLLHSAWLSHLEFEPAVRGLSERFRLVLPDLPLHGDSEDRPRHPYTLDWFSEVIAGFLSDVAGVRPLVGGHDAGAEILLHATLSGRVQPQRLVLMPNRLHMQPRAARMRDAWSVAARLGAIPGLDRALTHAARAIVAPRLGSRLSAQGAPGVEDLLRHAFSDVPGNPSLARSWAKCARHWPRGAQRWLLESYAQLEMPVLLLWADRDAWHPLAWAEQTVGLLPDGQLRVLDGTGFLMAYDDPVGFTRELVAFCG